MATAKKDTIEVPVQTTEKREVVVLTLTKEEALFLRAVTGHLGKEPGDGRRGKLNDGIFSVLADATDGYQNATLTPFRGIAVLKGD